MRNILCRVMTLNIMLIASFIIGFMASSAIADTTGTNNLVKFRGGIGVNPVSRITEEAATGAADRNDVRGVLPGGQPWVIHELKANVKKDTGQIKVKGRGLLFAGGNAIGTTGDIDEVTATLFCGPPEDMPEDLPSAHNSGAVPLDPNGDFRIDAILSDLPSLCDTPVLLVGAPNEDGGVARWFAAGIPKRESDDVDKDDDDDNGNEMGETTTTDDLTGVVLRVRCEVRFDRSKISVDGNNLNPADGPFTAVVVSGSNQAESAVAQDARGDEAEFDFDSDRGDIDEGATEIAPDFIQGNEVTGEILNASGDTIATASTTCEVKT